MSHQICLARRLFKATGREHTRAPSIGSTWISRSSRQGVTHCSRASTSPRTLSLAASLARLVKGWEVDSSYPAPRGSSRVAPHFTTLTRKMRLSDFCNRLPTRAPCTLPDSQSRALRPRNLGAFRRLPSRGLPDHESRVELRLTAILQLPLPCNLSGSRPNLGVVVRLTQAPRRSGEPRSKALPRFASRLGALSTSTRACSSASDAPFVPNSLEPTFRSTPR